MAQGGRMEPLAIGIWVLCSAIAPATPALAQSTIIPDDTLGVERSNVIQNFNGLPIEVIVDGTQRGQNLFHSFREFNVSAGRAAYFFSADASIQNILARVTGINRSEILGTLGTFGDSQPNLFLINPNGILFGPGATLDVGGSFVATTANAVQLGDTGSFSASNPASDNLLTINPSALFFNALNRQAAIVNQSSTRGFSINTNQLTTGLQVPDGRSLLFVGGEISLTGGIAVARGGRVELGGLAESGTVGLNLESNTPRLAFPEGVARADVSITDGSGVGVIIDDGGSIAVHAQNLTVARGSTIAAGINVNLGNVAGQAGNIDIDATGTVRLSEGSIIFNAVGPGTIGNGGDINVTAGSLILTEASAIAATTFGQGNAGKVTIVASDAVSLDGGDTSIFNVVAVAGEAGNSGGIDITARSLSITNRAGLDSLTFGQGNAGNIIIRTSDDVRLDGNLSRINSGVAEGAIGQGGNIDITTGSFSIFNGAQIAASTQGQGDAGNITIAVREDAHLDGFTFIQNSVLPGAIGKSGDITVTAKTLSLTNTAFFATITSGQGKAGDITLRVDDAIVIDGFLSAVSSGVASPGIGQAGDIDVTARSLSLTNGGTLSASTGGIGDAGTIRVRTSDFVLLSGINLVDGNSSAISSFAAANSTGKGGNITIDTDTFRVADGAVLDTRTDTVGDGGDITVNARNVEALNGGQLLTITSGSGRAGRITVNATEQVLVSGEDDTFTNRIAQFGTARISPISSASGFFVQSQGTGAAGDIEVTASTIRLDNQGRFIAESASGNGGNIQLNISDFLFLRRGSLISTTAGTAQAGGDGGNITITAPFVIGVRSENSDITANAFTGNGGRVNITAQGIYGLQFRPQLTPFSDITASSEFGSSGTVTLNTPDIDPSRGLIQLPVSLVDPSTQISQQCVPQGPQRASSFVATGRGGLPASPTEPLQDQTVVTEWVTVEGDREKGTGIRGQGDTENEEFATSPRFPISTSSRPLPISPPFPTDHIVEANGWIRDTNGTIVLVAEMPTVSPQNFWRSRTPCPSQPSKMQ